MSAARQVFSDALLFVAGALVVVLGFGALSRAFDRPPRDAPSGTDPAAQHGTVQVEILNGTGTDGLAGQTKAYLRGLGGFDVVDTRNAPRRTHDSTLVIDRVGNVEAARRVARALGLGPAHVRSDPRSNLLVDVSVILGADYRRLAPFHSSP